MHKNIEIQKFDIENHETYAVRDLDTDEVLGLVFQDPDEPFSTLMTVKISEEVDDIDLFNCAAKIIERVQDGETQNNSRVH